MALELAPESSGICGTSACWVPLDAHSPEGWRLQTGRIMLPSAVCDRLKDGRILSVAVTTACETKTSNIPLCGPWSSVPGDASVPDAASDSADGSELPPSCWPPTGTPGEVAMTAETPVPLASAVGKALNTGDFFQDPLAELLMDFLARGVGSCQTVGLLLKYRAENIPGSPWQLMYHDISDLTSQAPPLLQEFVVGELMASQNSSLFYDSHCMPTAMLSANTKYRQYERIEAGSWQGTDVELLEGKNVSGVRTLAAWQSSEGAMKLMAEATVNGIQKGLIGHRASGSEWTFSEFELPPASILFAIKEAPDGVIHAAYFKSDLPCDTCHQDLYHGALSSGGQWVDEIVQVSKWGEPDDEYAVEASLDFDSSGRPFMAATYMVRAITGSFITSELRYYGLTQTGWCHEVVATQNDGYFSVDGKNMTGIGPSMVIDTLDRPHIVFMDKAQWHNQKGWADGVDGQLRYAVRNGETWAVKTLLSQRPPTIGQKPLVGALPPLLAITPEGKGVHAVTTTFVWDTDSIYNAGPLGSSHPRKAVLGNGFGGVTRTFRDPGVTLRTQASTTPSGSWKLRKIANNTANCGHTGAWPQYSETLLVNPCSAPLRPPKQPFARQPRGAFSLSPARSPIQPKQARTT